MVRLQRCLRGRALESVRCRLLHPENVNGVIDTLKMLFGRPEIIVQSLIGKVQALPTPRADKLNTLVDFGIAVSNLTATLEACQLNEYLCNISLLQELVEKLPPMVKLNWATHRRCIKNVNFSEFSSWLYTLVEAACFVTSPFTGAVSDTPYNRKTRKNDGFVNVHSESADPRSGRDEETLATWRVCPACNGRWTSTDCCPRFTSIDVESRWVMVRERGLCRRCLRKHTGVCRSRKECGVNGCGYKHHSMLHNDTREINQTTTNRALAGEDSGDNTGPVEPCNTHRGIIDSVLFRIVPVVLHGLRMTIQTYALFDDGSSLTLIDEEIAETLQLPGEPYPLWLKWTGDTCRHEGSSRRVSVEISGTGPAAKRYYLENVHTVEDLYLPSQTVNIETLAEKYQHLRGIPVDSFQDARPRLLIGMNNCRLGHPINSQEGIQGPASKTRLGCVVFGNCSDNVVTERNELLHHSMHVSLCDQPDETDLNRLVKEYFSLEGIGITKPEKPLLSSADQRASNLLREYTHRKGDRYESGLLWWYDDIRLPDSKPAALRRLLCLENRMRKNPALVEAMRNKIHEYLQKGYMRKLTPAEVSVKHPRTWYLPIFPVFNPNKPGKLRIVWDAAASVRGVSLNSVLMTGPDLLTSLASVLLRFREHRVAVGGDVREMFHQVLVKDEDQYSQRFLWRNTEGDEPDVYVMKVMTFGASCSPSCAQYVKNHNALQFSERFPDAADATVKGHYVDDLLISVETQEDAIRLAKEVQFIHANAEFEIHQWISNFKQVLCALQNAPTAEKT
ncbi:uncharacterized protein LOC131695786 [Topomyia yanbarensis]|uniref:uncharacterized protein LOC131695786 n=1 Tax=Topomyia yanbarensis TaxID=2498891 RepID=UPI00273CA1D4|nr:uncharacterized protein LOC131695786 [Topomyia yanbarensis]